MRTFVLFLVLAVAVPAAAQEVTPAVDLSGGYSAVNVDAGVSDGNTWSGWVVSGSVTVTRLIAVAVDAGGNYFSRTSFFGIQGSQYSFAGGARFTGRGRRASAYGQMLAGVVSRQSYNTFMLLPGVAVDVWLTPRLGARVGVDARLLYDSDDEAWSSQPRVHAGVVVALGTR